MSLATNDRRVRLVKPLERTVHAGHPWIYRRALGELEARAGEVVTVLDRRGRFLARGVADTGPIAVRVYTTRDEPVGEALFARRLRQALELRKQVIPSDTTAFRLVHGEGDRLPGVVVDIYGQHAVLQLDGDGLSVLRDQIVAPLTPLLEELSVHTLHERSGRRGKRRTDRLFGPETGERIEVREHGMRLLANVVHGQKTGLFLDHRESRRRVRGLARGRRVLNLYGYTGGFSVAAGLGGAVSVDTVDVAPEAIALADASWEINDLPKTHAGHVSDVREFLVGAEAADKTYDLIVADPPSFAPSEGKVSAALATYKALHGSALGRLSPGGLYVAASCSSHVTRSDFEDTLAQGARRSRRVLQVLDRWEAPEDHPNLLAFPEGNYLKVVLLRALDWATPS